MVGDKPWNNEKLPFFDTEITKINETTVQLHEQSSLLHHAFAQLDPLTEGFVGITAQLHHTFTQLRYATEGIVDAKARFGNATVQIGHPTDGFRRLTA